MKAYSCDKIKNIALAGHSGSGKTSLTEALLWKAKASDRFGKVADGNTVSDYDPEEIKRKVSIQASLASLEWEGNKVNIIDTPGLFDFAGGLYEGVRAAESVIVVVSARSGMSVGAEKAYKLAQEYEKSSVIFITKMDGENADFMKVLEDMRSELSSSICPVVVPYMVDGKPDCYVNLLDMKAYKYNDKGEASECPLPDGLPLDDLVSELSEAVAETDEALMEKYFAGEAFTKEELIQGVKHGVATKTLTPVFCGAGLSLQAVDMFLDGVVNLLPSAQDGAGETAKDQKGEDVAIACSESDPLALYVFKTVADPFVGKLSYCKVVSGTLKSDMQPTNARTGNAERMGKLLLLGGKKQTEIDAIGAGDIGAITKLGDTITGDSLCDAKRVVNFRTPNFPRPALSMAIKAKSKGDEGKISQGFQRLMEEDTTASFGLNPETKQQILSGLGEQHIDVLVSKLKAKFGVEVELSKPRVPFRETVRKKVKVQGKHKKQTGGHGQFGDVWIEFEPTDADELVFAENVFGGSVPRNFFPAVEKGLRDASQKGVLAGYPVVGLKATLVDGSYHPVDSSEMSFKMAASIAYREGVAKAGPVLLEPIGNLKVYVPDQNTGDIIGDLNKRRGRVLGMNPAGDKLQEVEAEVPMAEMHDFATSLRSIAQGRGHYAFEFVRYEQLPQNLEAGVIEEAQKLKEEEE